MMARILERWDMPLPDVHEDRWFLDWVLRSPAKVSHHITAGWCAYLDLYRLGLNPHTAREYFGGIGAQTRIIDELFPLDEHVVLERSPEAVAHLQRQHIAVQQADSYDPRNTAPADLVGLDFGDLTAWKAQPGRPPGDLLERVFTLEPLAVVLTDIVGAYLHLQHATYEPLLGVPCRDQESYTEAFARHIEKRFGYVLVSGYRKRWSTVFAFAAEGPRGAILETPDTPRGLALR